jgi:hypothetical protein
MEVQAPDIVMTPEEIFLAKERGRRMEAEAVRCNPEARKRVETKYGIEFCKNRWPEAYGLQQGS